MISGRVHELQALVSIRFRLKDRPDIEIEFVVDTGFEGALTLPPAAVVALDLPFSHEMAANLANDVSVRTDVHTATIELDGRERDVLVLAIGRRPLLGTALLAGKEFVAQFIPDGLVRVEEV